MRHAANLLGVLILVGTSLTSASAVAAACEARSGNTAVALLELYTSEGCNSCPPADRWIAELPQRGMGADRVVPLAWHVDYWDYLGWNDPFAQTPFSQRQREFARRNNTRTVYTPEFALNGREYRHSSFEGLATDLDRINPSPPQADLTLHLAHADRTLRVSGTATLKQPLRPAATYVALYENNLVTAVRAGENQGRTLRHEFVVRQLIGPISFDAAGTARFTETLTLNRDWKPRDLGVAAFVQEVKGTGILQALALPMCQVNAAKNKNPVMP